MQALEEALFIIDKTMLNKKFLFGFADEGAFCLDQF